MGYKKFRNLAVFMTFLVLVLLTYLRIDMIDNYDITGITLVMNIAQFVVSEGLIVIVAFIIIKKVKHNYEREKLNANQNNK